MYAHNFNLQLWQTPPTIPAPYLPVHRILRYHSAVDTDPKLFRIIPIGVAIVGPRAYVRIHLKQEFNAEF